ncbi:MAG: response regulator transcription factor [Dehalococcoidia bacterium]|nr:response regulator transcription factor [Dehalococcoidia bacterium]
MPGQLKILLIEDNADIREVTNLIFEMHMPEARIIPAIKGADGLALMKSESPDMIILDLGLPDMDGMKVLKEIRSYSDIPIVILTIRGDETDKVRGLEMGADDYIVKPFNHNELLARVKAVFRHRGKRGAARIKEEVKAAPAAARAVPKEKKIKMDVSAGTVQKNGEHVKLSTTELNLLKYLVSHEGKVISGDDILTKIWGIEYVDCLSNLQQYIRHLREKLEDNPDRPEIIVQEENGYKIARNAVDYI